MLRLETILQKERTKRKLTMKDFAKDLELNADTYRRYERGERQPDLETLLRIADKLNTSTDYLLGRYST